MRKYDMISGLAETTAKDVVRNEESWRSCKPKTGNHKRSI